MSMKKWEPNDLGSGDDGVVSQSITNLDSNASASSITHALVDVNQAVMDQDVKKGDKSRLTPYQWAVQLVSNSTITSPQMLGHNIGPALVFVGGVVIMIVWIDFGVRLYA